MGYSFMFDSSTFVTNDTCNLIEIEIWLEAYKEDFSWGIIEIFDVDSQVFRTLESFSPEDKKLIDKLGEECALKYASEAYQDKLENSPIDSRYE